MMNIKISLPEKEPDLTREFRIPDHDTDTMIDIPKDTKCFICRDYRGGKYEPLCKYMGVLLCPSCYIDGRFYDKKGIANTIKQIKESELNDYR